MALRPKRSQKIPSHLKNFEHELEEESNNEIEESSFSTNDSSTNEQDNFSTLSRGIPSFDPLPNVIYHFNGLAKSSFEEIISNAFIEITKWKPNLFVLPTGNAGTQFINESAMLLNAFANQSAFEKVALQAAFVFQTIMLQKSHSKAAGSSNRQCLVRRLDMWKNGQIEGIVKEGQIIQKYISSGNKGQHDEPSAFKFSKLIGKGKIKRALNMIKTNRQNGVLNLDDVIDGQNVREILQSKHPDAKPATPESLAINSSMPEKINPPEFHPIIFEKLNAAFVKKVILSMKGAAGPTGVDSAAWRRFCTMYGAASADLCDAIAACAKRLATTYCDPESLCGFTSARLIPLNKNPGVRPIGIGITLRRIICKCINRVTKPILQETIKCSQMCAGQDCGCEACVHSMRTIFNDSSTEAILLVDAQNAFNSLNRAAMLENIQTLCPILAPTVINLYRQNADLFTANERFSSSEGTTQGDPLAMPIYAVSTLPLIHLMKIRDVQQVWYADDAAAGGQLQYLHDWWEKLMQQGHHFGYFPNGSKSWLIVKKEYEEKAKKMFHDTDLNITTEGRPYLGSAIGTDEYVRKYVKNKVEGWVKEIEALTRFAHSQPQAVYAAFINGVIGEWTYLSKTTPCLDNPFEALEEKINSHLIPAMTGQPCPNKLDRALLSIPPRLGGLGMIDPCKLLESYHSSVKITGPLTDVILGKEIYSCETMETLAQTKRQYKKAKHEALEEEAIKLMQELPSKGKVTMQLAAEKGASSWLTVLPLHEYGFALHKGAFRDALCLRYGWRPPHIPINCICGSENSTEHALSCRVGGYPIFRHNAIRDNLANMLDEVCHDVASEPHLQALTGEKFTLSSASTDDAVRLDVAANGVFGGRFERTYFDIRVFNPFARSNSGPSLESVYARHEAEKKRKYEQRILEVEHSSFIPFVMSCTGGYGPSATMLVKHLSARLAEKRNIPYSKMVQWVRCKLAFSMLRSSIMCLRGAKRRHSVIVKTDQTVIAMAESGLG